jgi:hypothetical protein
MPSVEYRNKVVPTYLENWPMELQRLTIAQVAIPLTLEEAEALGTNIVELYELFPEPHFRNIQSIMHRIDMAVNSFPNGAFIRLGSRSPKDSLYGYSNGFQAKDGVQALKILLGVSERVSDDLQAALEWKYAPYIYVREWLQIPQWSELRCFMKGRKLAGISQYNYMSGHLEFLDKNVTPIRFAIEQFFDRFRSACHLDDVVFDVIVKHREMDNVHDWSVKLLEINPFFEYTDPCLFSWAKKDDFDGSFRVCKEGTKGNNFSKYQGPL